MCTRHDSLVICPFDKSHHILSSRIQYHLIKCAKNFPNSKKVICPYDATEYIEPEDFPKHLFECKSKRTIDLQTYANDKMFKNKQHGEITNAPFHYPGFEQPDEDWAAGLEMSPDTSRPKTASTWNSSLTTKPKISSQGRGKLLKEHLDQINNPCDGFYCKKSCCPKNQQSKGVSRGGLLRKYLSEGVNAKPLGRAALLKMYCERNMIPEIGNFNNSINNVKQNYDEQFDDANS